MKAKTQWCLFVFYMAVFGSFCGLEIDTFVGDLPFFHISTLLLFFNVLFVPLFPIVFYALFASIRRLWAQRALRVGVLLLNAIYFHFVAFLALYKSVRKIDFDFYFFWYNTADTLPALWKIFAPWLFVLVLSIAAWVIFQTAAFAPVMSIFRKSPRRAGLFLTTLFVFSLLCQLATIHSIRGSATGFLYASFFSDRRLRDDYRKLYRNHIAALQAHAPGTNGPLDLSRLGDVVFLIKQESLNGLLVSPTVTPQLLRASRDGILFPRFYSNSIQSLRGYECILCGVPPSAAGALVDDSAEELKKLNCIPKLFKRLGYRTLYFFGGSRNPRIVQLAQSIGFEKVLADDIVRPGDIKFDWGYREDIFFTRVDAYLQKHYVNEKLFVFIDTGATNHTPFDVLDDALLDKVPFPRPEKFLERISNTTFVQDAYFGRLYDIFSKHYAHRGSLLAVSDHAWPIPLHKDNIYNERGAYEENFLAALLFIPPSSGRQDFAAGTTVTQRFSQMDILPTIVELIGLKQDQWLGESFAPWLLASPNRERLAPQKAKISIQPYGGGFISVIRYPQKYLFDILGRNVKVFDLQKDPGELSPAVHDVDEYMFLIKEFFGK